MSQGDWKPDYGLGQYVNPYANNWPYYQPYTDGGTGQHPTAQEIEIMKAARELEMKRKQRIFEEQAEVARIQKEREEEHRRKIARMHSDWVLAWVEYILGTHNAVLFKMDKATALNNWKELGLELDKPPGLDDPLGPRYPQFYTTNAMEVMKFKGTNVAFFMWQSGQCSLPVKPLVDAVQ